MTMFALLGQDLFELPDDFFDTIEDECERVEYRATLNPRATFPELYRQRKGILHIHVYGSLHGQLGNYCAVFVYDPIANTSIYEGIPEVNGGWMPHSDGCPSTYQYITTQSSRISESNVLESTYSTDDMKQSVFIGVIDVGEESKGVSVESFQSVVRLEPLIAAMTC